MKNFLTTLFSSKHQSKTDNGISENCPLNEQTGDGVVVGRCWFHLDNGEICPRHGDVSKEIKHFLETGELTLENSQRKRLGKNLLPINNSR